jgi:hypothetical protein
MSQTTQYRALKKITVNTPNHTGVVEVGEVTKEVKHAYKIDVFHNSGAAKLDMGRPSESELMWENYKGTFNVQKAIKEGWIKEVKAEPAKVMEYNSNGSCENKPEDGSEYHYVDENDFAVESTTWDDDDCDKFRLMACNVFDDGEKAKLWVGVLRFKETKLK